MWNTQQGGGGPSAEVLQHPYLRLELDAPPVRIGYNALPEMVAVVPLMTAALAIEIQSNAENNPLRKYMFNLYAFNGFNNDDFARLVTSAMDYLTGKMIRGAYQTLDIGLTAVVKTICELTAASLVDNNPYLQNLIPPNMVGAVRGHMQAYANMGAELEQMRRNPQGNNGGGNAWNNNQQQGGGQQNWGRDWPAQGNNGGGGGSGGWGNGGNSRWGNGQSGGGQRPPTGRKSMAHDLEQISGAQTRVGAAAPQANLLASGTQSRIPIQSLNPEVIDTVATVVDPNAQKLSQLDRSLNLMDEPKDEFKMNTETINQPQAANLASQTSVGFPEGETPNPAIKWERTDAHPYYPAYHMTTHSLHLGRDLKNEYVIQLEKREKPVDYNRHVLPGTFGNIPTTVHLADPAQALAKISDGLDELAEVHKVADPGDLPEGVRQVFDPVAAFSLSEDEMWLQALIQRSKLVGAETPSVFQCFARVGIPIVTKYDETDAIATFRTCETYLQLRDQLIATANEIDPYLWATVNRLMTEKVNRVLSQQMAIPGALIEDFHADIEDMINGLRTGISATVAEAFTRKQAEYIRSVLVTPREIDAAKMNELYLENQGFTTENKPFINYVASDYSLTLLNVRVAELDLAVHDTVASAVIEKASPVLKKMLVELFQLIDSQGADFDKHLIRTADGKIFEATRGLFGREFFLIKPIK